MRTDDTTWDALVSDLYLSAIDPEAAARLPAQLAALTGGVLASSWRLRPSDCAVVGPMVTNGPAEAQDAYRQHYYQFDPYQSAVQGVSQPVVMRGTDMIDPDTLTRSVYYNEFGVTYGMFHQIGAVVPVGSGAAATVGVVSILRPRGATDFDEAAARALQRLVPHLVGASRLHDQLGAAVGRFRRDALGAALDALPSPALITDGDGAVQHVNAAASELALVRGWLARRANPHRRLQLPAGAARDRLAGLIAAAARGEAGGACRVLDRVAEVLPVPMRLAALTGAPRGQALVLIRPLEPPPGLPARVAAAFGLTEAEAAVAAALASGESPAEIAERRGSKISTVRTLLARALDKTDSRNLRDLVRTVLAIG